MAKILSYTILGTSPMFIDTFSLIIKLGSQLIDCFQKVLMAIPPMRVTRKIFWTRTISGKMIDRFPIDPLDILHSCI
jgi:hypothetical protein